MSKKLAGNQALTRNGQTDQRGENKVVAPM